jgi:hypothetical protein
MKVQIAIENYNDLFSDFDIRSYSERYISSDFLNELRMRTYKVLNRKGIEITLVIPEGERDAEDERIIIKRLHDFFQIRRDRNIKKRNGILLKSIFLEVVGIGCMFVANFLSKYTIEYFKDFMLIPSWFFVWNGLEKYFDHRKILDKKIKYYSFISESRIRFESMQEDR